MRRVSLDDEPVRGGRVSWLTHPVIEETTPGELLAITHGVFMAAELADILQDRGSPAVEIVVDAHASFGGRRTARVLEAIDLYVEGRVPGLEPRALQDAVEIAWRRCVEASGARRDTPGSVEHVLA